MGRARGTPWFSGQISGAIQQRRAGMILSWGRPVDVSLPQSSRRWRTILIALSLGLGLIGLGRFWNWSPPGATVPRSSLWIGQVRRGDMLREVQARGSLVPTDLYWVTATTAGRVERLAVKAGSAVQADQLIVQLSNPELELRALEAKRLVAAARSHGFALQEAALRARVSEHAQLFELQGKLRSVAARFGRSGPLLAAGVVTPLDHEQTAAEYESLAQQVRAYQTAQLALGTAAENQLKSAQDEQAHLEKLAQFNEQRLTELTARAAVTGIVAELRVELGQWVMPGTTLAKVVGPSHLVARLSVPEAQAKDLSLGQSARVELGEQFIPAQTNWIAPAVENGTVSVDLSLPAPLPAGARPDRAIVGSIQIERLKNVLFVDRPRGVAAGSNAQLFKLQGPNRAVRQAIRFGRVSALTIEILAGLDVGDELILSDISMWDPLTQLNLSRENE